MRVLGFLFLAAGLLRAQPVGLSYVYGNGQMGPALTTTAPIVVQVIDKDGKPVANSPVIWTVVQGAPTPFTAQPQTTYSNANGYASSYLPAYEVDPSLSFNLVAVEARGLAGLPLKFYFTSLATSISNEVLSPNEDQNQTINTRVGALEKGAYQVLITAYDGPQAGQPIPNVGLRVLNVMPGRNTSGYYDYTLTNDPRLPSATCANNTLSDSTGVATCDLLIGPKTGTARLYVLLGEYRLLPVITLNVGVGAPAMISPAAGGGQIGTPNSVLPLPLSVHVTDSGANNVANATVTWTLLSGSASITSASTLTDSSGNTSNTVTLGSTPGAVRIRAQIPSGAVADFNLSNVLGVSSIQVVSGDNQSALTGATFASPLVVRAVNSTGAAVGGIPVQFTVTGGTPVTAIVSTDNSGIAATRVTAGANPGLMLVTASAQGFQATFSKLVVYAPGPRLDVSGIRNAATSELGLTPCGLVTISAIGLAPGVEGVIRGLDPTATTLGPVDSIRVGGVDAIIREVSNVEGKEAAIIQTPCGVPAGSVEVAVTVQGLSNRITGVPVFQYQPGVFEVADGDHQIGWAIHADGSLINATSPAVRGEVIRVFSTGLGSPTGNLELGMNDAGVPTVSFGNLSDQPGLSFVEVAIPTEVASRDGRVDFVVSIKPTPASDSIYSNTVAIPIR